MYKIRLYVVPEAGEDEQHQQQQREDVAIDDFDLTDELPPIMQRRNSRRPAASLAAVSLNATAAAGCGAGGSVKLNVIQKDRKVIDSNSLTPKLKQTIRQQLNEAKDETIVKNNNNTFKNFETNKLPTKSVFKSPKIQKLAVNLQEKMMERQLMVKINSSNADNEMDKKKIIDEKKLNFNYCQADETPRKIIRNENNNNVGGSLSPIFEINSPRVNSMPINETKLRSSGKLMKQNQISVIYNNNSPKNINVDGSTVRFLSSPIKVNSNGTIENKVLINHMMNDVNDNLKNDGNIIGDENSLIDKNFGGIQTNSINSVNNINNNNNNSNNSVILRKNNKLNRYREYDLEQKIEVEIKMREGSARLLAAARHRAQSLEAARALLTSNERMSAYMAELQRRKKEPSSNKPSLPVSTARVSLSDLRVPLMWRDSDHFKNRGDYRRFAVFCLARVGTEIHDTALLCPVDRALTDVTFPDVLVFNNVPSEFEVTLEIYSHILQEDLSIASTPRRIKRSLHSSISRTVGKKLAASLRDELNSGKIGPHFELMASARLTLDDTDDNIHTHDLVLNNLENKNHSLPLFGHFCCRLAAQPECVTKEACSGSVVLDGRTCWARIQGFKLQAWDSRKLAEEEQRPWSTVPINRETLIQPSKSSSKELRISNTIDGSDKITTIKLETSEEAQKWVRQLVAHAKDHLRWKHAAENIQDVPSVESARNSFISNKRQGSLYDETPLIESVQSDYTATRPTVHEIFGLTPSTSLSSCSSTSSPPSLRSRSLSTSGPRKSGTNTLRSHWPFSNKNYD